MVTNCAWCLWRVTTEYALFTSWKVTLLFLLLSHLCCHDIPSSIHIIFKTFLKMFQCLTVCKFETLLMWGLIISPVVIHCQLVLHRSVVNYKRQRFWALLFHDPHNPHSPFSFFWKNFWFTGFKSKAPCVITAQLYKVSRFRFDTLVSSYKLKVKWTKILIIFL